MPGSIFIRHHYSNGGLRVVTIEGAATGNQLNQTWCAVVVTHIERKRQAGLSGLCFADSKTEHPDNIPTGSMFFRMNIILFPL